MDTKNDYSVLILLNNKNVNLPTVGQSYNDWNSKNILTPSVTDWAGSDGFYMANAPLKGSAASPATLVPIDKIKYMPARQKQINLLTIVLQQFL